MPAHRALTLFVCMFETSFLLRLAPPALDGTIPLQPDYNDCWQVWHQTQQ
jgi:hypothetical protein